MTRSVDRLARVDVVLRALLPPSFAGDPAVAVHAALHRLIEIANPLLGRRIHGEAVKSLVIGPLRDAHSGAPVSGRPVTSRPMLVRLGLLNSDSVLSGLRALELWKRERLAIMLDGVPFAVEDVQPASPREPGAGFVQSYAQIASSAEPTKQLHMRFTSPTIVRHRQHAIQEISPQHLFNSYARRWNTFAPPDLAAIELDEGTLNANVRLLRRDLTRTSTHASRFGESGFVGEIVLAVGGSEAFRRHLHILALYAEYAGTGSRTAFGMGETQLVC